MAPIVLAAIAALLLAAGAPQTLAPGPTFDAVSIKRNTNPTGPVRFSVRPGGGLVMVNGTAGMLIGQAYSWLLTSEIVGLPAWVSVDRFDITATSQGQDFSMEKHSTMLRAMLADRFKMAAHVERRDVPAYDLVMARRDGRPGPALKATNIDCAARAAAERVAAEQARAQGLPPPRPPAPADRPAPCEFRSGVGKWEGQTDLAQLALTLRGVLGRAVVDKTGLTGSFTFALRFAPVELAADPGAQNAQGGDAPSIFTALQEQLGLKLEPSRALVDVMVIDHLERPSEN